MQEVKDSGRELNYPGSSMAYAPEGSGQEARSVSMNRSSGDVNTRNTRRLPAQSNAETQDVHNDGLGLRKPHYQGSARVPVAYCKVSTKRPEPFANSHQAE